MDIPTVGYFVISILSERYQNNENLMQSYYRTEVIMNSENVLHYLDFITYYLVH